MLLAARRGGDNSGRYVVPSPSESAAFGKLITRVASDPTLGRDDIDALARAVGYAWVDVPELPGTGLLRELDTRKRGGGAYLLRPHASSRVIVQAPHTFFDEGTLPLACELFQRTAGLALFVDTAHRYRAAEMDDHGEYPADVAHAPLSLFQAATESLLRATREATVVQVHGFAQRAEATRVVVSTGAARPAQPFTARVAMALGTIVGPGVARFPDDTAELGATKNVQGKATRAAGGRFLHLEIDAPLRRALLSDEMLRERFLDAIARSVTDP